MGKASRRKRGDIRTPGDSARQTARSGLRCDFCLSPEVRWGYRTANDPTEQSGSGGWAACDTCHDLIERGQHTALARRSAKIHREKYTQLSAVPFDRMVDLLQQFHDEFRAARVGPTLTAAEYKERYGDSPSAGTPQFMKEVGANLLAGEGERIGRVKLPGDEVLHHTLDEQGESYYIPEGFTAEQLADPETINFIMKKIKRDRPVPNISFTQPMMELKHWVGARNYLQAVSAIYGENPRSNDVFDPRPAMMVARMILEAALTAHPVVLEPEQMNAIDDSDWSFAESIDYAKMAYLPFEPLYLDFGGHQKVLVDLQAGPCQLHGAVIWRSAFFKTPTLAVAPIGGFEYLTGPLADKMIADGVDEELVRKYVGIRPGKDIPVARQQKQWCYQPAGICWFGVQTELEGAFSTYTMRMLQDRGEAEIPMVFSSNRAIAKVLGEERLSAESEAMILTGMFDSPNEGYGIEDEGPWNKLALAGTEMVAKLAERALLGLYFIENAPVGINEIPLSRPERREMERKTQKGRDPGEIASIVTIQSRRSDSKRSEHPQEVEHEYRWERRGYFMHIHENNRHYQNRPDLVKSCHKCGQEYAQNEAARRENRIIPHPHCESPNCIKIWVEPTICGPEGKPLKKKVRIRRVDRREAA